MVRRSIAARRRLLLYGQYAHQPPEPVTFTYEELKGNVSGWIDAWARQFASK